jgi:hypothetical protein
MIKDQLEIDPPIRGVHIAFHLCVEECLAQGADRAAGLADGLRDAHGLGLRLPLAVVDHPGHEAGLLGFCKDFKKVFGKL